jgi:hypothetical protein
VSELAAKLGGPAANPAAHDRHARSLRRQLRDGVRHERTPGQKATEEDASLVDGRECSSPAGRNHSEAAKEAKQENDLASHRQFKLVEDTLFVVGLGIDAANPQ